MHQSTPPLEKDVRRRLDLVGDSCSHLSKREQITVMGFDAIGQNKDGFSMKKCHKNSKVVFFHIYVVHCCYMNLSFHTDWWFLLVPFFFVHVSHLVSCCTCWHRTCRSMFRPSNNFPCKTIGGKDDLTWKALKFSELFCHQNDVFNFIISEFVLFQKQISDLMIWLMTFGRWDLQVLHGQWLSFKLLGFTNLVGQMYF